CGAGDRRTKIVPRGIRLPPLSPRFLSLLTVLSPADAVPDDAAWPTGSARASARLPHLLQSACHLDFERAAATGTAGELGADDSSWTSAEFADAASGKTG